MKDLTILMTGAGAPGAPGIIKCYKKNAERNIKIIGVDIKERVPTFCMLDKFYQVPVANSSNFCDKILEIAIQERVNIIQPLVTKELEIFAEKISLFENKGIQVCVSPLQNLKIANDKGKLMDFLSKNGIDTHDYVIINSAKEFTNACKKMGYPHSPICFKPTKSNGSRGFRIIDPNKNLFDNLFYEKPNSMYTTMEQIEKILLSVSEIPELLVMEYLPGDEYSVDILAKEGNAIVILPRRRLATNGGISTCCIVEQNIDVVEYCRKIVELLKLDGNIGIQVKADIKGQFKILEINPRVQGSIVSCAAAGVNLPYLAIKSKLNETISIDNIKWNIEMIRYWNEVYYDERGHAFTF